jgi:hypothetical protein
MGIPIFDAFVEFFFDNIMFIAIVGFLGYYAYQYFDLKKRTSFKLIDRADIERKLFIKRMKMNVSNNFKWLYRGFKKEKVFIRDKMGFGEQIRYKHGKLMGKIKYYMESTVPKYKEQKLNTAERPLK